MRSFISCANAVARNVWVGVTLGAALAGGGAFASLAFSQELPTVDAVAPKGSFQGEWTYRSFVNVSDPAIAPNDLLFGLAVLALQESEQGAVTGTIGGNGWSLAITGQSVYEPGFAYVKFQGSGAVGAENWTYDYYGYLAPRWSNGVNQVPAIVGTVVRTAPHGGAPAGFVASFIAVRQE